MSQERLRLLLRPTCDLKIYELPPTCQPFEGISEYNWNWRAGRVIAGLVIARWLGGRKVRTPS
jgi:hypothetical protein